MASMLAFVAMSTALLQREKVHVAVSRAFQESEGVNTKFVKLRLFIVSV